MKRFTLTGVAAASALLYSCAQAPAPEARITDLVHGIAKNVPVLVEGDSFESSLWLSVAEHPEAAKVVETARSSEFFVAAQREFSRVLAEDAGGGGVPPMFLGLDDILVGLGEGGAPGAGAAGPATGPGAIGSGSLPSAPVSGGGGSLPTAPASGGGGSLPQGPGSVQGAFTATPALFAAMSSGGGGSAGIGEAYCSIYSGLINFFDRCIPEFADVRGVVSARFGESFCRSALAPAIERTMAAAPAGLADTFSCIGDGFRRASCGNIEQGLSTALDESVRSCGISLKQ